LPKQPSPCEEKASLHSRQGELKSNASFSQQERSILAKKMPYSHQKNKAFLPLKSSTVLTVKTTLDFKC
jgi:hypothetical protein